MHLRHRAAVLLALPGLVGCSSAEDRRSTGPDDPASEEAVGAPCDAVADEDLSRWLRESARAAGPTDRGPGRGVECRAITDGEHWTSATWSIEPSSGSRREDVADAVGDRRRRFELPSGAPAVRVAAPGLGLVTVVSWPSEGEVLVVEILDYGPDGHSVARLSRPAVGIATSYDG